MTSSFTVTPDAIVPAAEVAAAAVARTPARWHWDEKKEGSAAGSRECRARRELQPGGRAAGWSVRVSNHLELGYRQL